NVALNISQGIGPKTSYIFSYWFPHESIPAVTDLYGPGYHYFLSLFLLVKDEFISLRISSLVVGMCSILLAYIIGRKIHSTFLGYLSALVICFNFFHIENSTVIMRENFNLLIVQLFFLNLFYLKKNKLLFSSIGIIIGYSAMTSAIWMILSIIFIFYLIANYEIKKIDIFFNILLTSIFFMITIFPWAKISLDYFGKMLFSYTSYYPYVNDWGLMMSERGLPNVTNFWSEIDIVQYLKAHFYWGINNMYKFCLVLFPTFAFPASFILIPLILIGSYQLKFNGYLLLLFTVLYFFALLFGSYGMKGILWPRHFMPFLATTSILMSFGFIFIYHQLIKFNIINKYLTLFTGYKFYKLVFLIPIIITLVGIEVKDSFWERDSSQFYKFGNKIKEYTNINDVIMYANSVPDAWCVTKRKIVQDPAFYKKNTSNRILEEVRRFDVDYLLVDVSDQIYQRGKDIVGAIKFYNQLELEEIFSDEKNGYHFYKIANKP
ncbi:hypothetical protein N9B99_05800, partial [Candidatus Pelagibacter sp.]|nr:hypothetical protein [Candidatus Pelagibacter sp.]